MMTFIMDDDIHYMMTFIMHYVMDHEKLAAEFPGKAAETPGKKAELPGHSFSYIEYDVLS